MVNAVQVRIFTPARVAATLKLAGKVRGPRAPLGACESNELAWNEIAGERSDGVEKAGLLGRVAQGPDRGDAFRWNSHSEKTLALSSCRSRTRRRWSASPRGVKSRNPARTFSATLRPR